MDDDTVSWNPRELDDEGPAALPVNRSDSDFEFPDLEEIEEAVEGVQQGKVPEPALIRGLLVAVVGLVGLVVGKSFDLSWVDPVIGIYAVVGPVVLSWWIRRNVTPVPKV